MASADATTSTNAGAERIADAFANKTGRAALMPYLMGGFPDVETSREIGLAYADGGADLVELGVPYSDPLADGPVIHDAGTKALAAGATLDGVLDVCGTLSQRLPVVLMCYVNLVLARGAENFVAAAVQAGASGLIVPDLPLEEAGPWCTAADASSIETVMLAAPTAPDDRLPRVCARARGFVYSVGLLGVTGERTALAATATALAARLKAVTEVPVLVGVGVSNAAQAREAVQVADGVVQGASVVRRLLEGGADAVGEYITEVRSAIDS